AMRASELYTLAGRVRPTLFRGVGEALGYVRNNRPVLVLTGMAIVVMSLSFNVNVLLPVLAKQTLSAGPQTVGIVTACFGAGALVGALVAAGVGKPRWRVLLVSVTGLWIGGLAFVPLLHAIPPSAPP